MIEKIFSRPVHGTSLHFLTFIFGYPRYEKYFFCNGHYRCVEIVTAQDP